MNITRQAICDQTSLTGLSYERPNTQPTEYGKEKLIDIAYFVIDHKGISKLECNIHNENEYLACFIHFEAGTENLINICLPVGIKDGDLERLVDADILTNKEREVVVNYALEKLKKARLQS